MSGTHLLRRHPKNPILTAADFPRPVNSVFNAGAIKFDGQYLLLTRVENLSGSSCLWLARSDDGVRFTPDPEPALLPATEEPFRAVMNPIGIELAFAQDPAAPRNSSAGESN